MKLKSLLLVVDLIGYGLDVTAAIATVKYLKRIYGNTLATAEMLAHIHDQLIRDEEEDFEEENG